MQPATAQLESTKWYENGISALCGGWAGGGDNEDTGASRVENMLRVLAARQSTVLTRALTSQNGTLMYIKCLSAKILIERQF